MADSAVAVTAGTGTTIDTYQIASGDHQQIIRQAKATAKTDNSWTVATTAVSSQVAADASRIGIMMVNGGSGRVYIRFDATLPTPTTAATFLEAGDRYEVPEYAVTLTISVLGQFAGGILYTTLFTSA